jgi:3-hydroxybutyryl-CoA dehydrogenase
MPEKAQASVAKIKAADLSAWPACDLVLEAIIERLLAKRELFSKLMGLCGKKTFFAYKASAIAITRIGQSLVKPLVGLHFFSRPSSRF